MSTSKDDFQLVKLIQKLEIFRDLSREEALNVLQMCQRRSYATDEVVWNPGDSGEDMQVLLSGKLHVKDKDGKLIGEVLPGASFGEMACLSGSRRFVGFVAVEPSSALCLMRITLRALTSQNPDLYVRILETTIKVLALRVSRSRSGQAVDEAQPGSLSSL